MLKCLFQIIFIFSVNFIHINCEDMNVYKFSKQFTRHISPSVSAVLMECPKKDVAPVCDRKIVVNIKVNPSRSIGKVERYLILDEIYDQTKKSRAKLMSPYLIEITRGEPVLMYPLRFVKDLQCTSCAANSSSFSKENFLKRVVANQRNVKATEGGSKNKNSSTVNETSEANSVAAKKIHKEIEPFYEEYPQMQDYNQNSFVNLGNDDSSISNSQSNRELGKEQNPIELNGNYDYYTDLMYDSDQDRMKTDFQKSVKRKSSLKDQKTNPFDRAHMKCEHCDRENSSQKQRIQNRFVENERGVMMNSGSRAHERSDPQVAKKSELPFQELNEESSNSDEFNGDKMLPRSRRIGKSKTSRTNDRQKTDTVKGTKVDQKKDASFVTYVNGFELSSDPWLSSNYTTQTDPEFSSRQIIPFIGKQDKCPIKVHENQINDKLIHDSTYFRHADSHDKVHMLHSTGKRGRKIESQQLFPYNQFSGHNSNNGAHFQIKDKNQSPPDSSFLSSSSSSSKVKDSFQNISPFSEGFYSNSLNDVAPQKPTGYGDPIESLRSDDNRIDKIYDSGNYFPHNGNDKFGSGSYENFRDNSFHKKNQMKKYKLRRKSYPNKGRTFASDISYKANGEQEVEDSRRWRGNDFRNINSGQDSPSQNAFHRGNIEGKARSRDYRDEYYFYYDDDSNLVRYPEVYKNNLRFDKYSKVHSPRIIPKVVLVPGEHLDGSDYFNPETGDKQDLRWGSLVSDYGENAHTKVFGDTPTEYLPKPVPFEEVIDDPNLNTDDKMRLMEMIDPKDEDQDKVMKYFENEIQTSHFNFDPTKNDRAPIPVLDQLPEKLSKRKRSYFLYNDLTVNDAYRNDYENVEALRNLAEAGTENKDTQQKHNSVSDVWYSVYDTNAPLQYLSTRIRIFRKKGPSWWKIVPAVTLTSFSGVYANANLSILFSSHAEVYNFDLKKHKLLVPKKDIITPKEILAFQDDKWNFDTINSNSRFQDSLHNAALKCLRPLDEQVFDVDINKRNEDGIYSVLDFGDFPSELNIMEQCKDNPMHLCLNLLEDQVPGYKINIQIPFVDNDIVHLEYNKVRITNIIADATTRGSVDITLTMINEGFVGKEFSVIIFNCPVTCGAKNIVRKLFPPHRGETVTFLLPLQENNPSSKFYCEAHVTNDLDEIIAKRQLIIQPAARCLCIWHCKCSCFGEHISETLTDVCESSIIGIVTESQPFVLLRKLEFNMYLVYGIVAFFILFFMTLGCCKACFGCCAYRIGRWKFHYFPTASRYEDHSRCRRFCLNTLFFLILPFLVICKCFVPSEEDLLLSSASWECSVLQQEIDSDGFISDNDEESEVDLIDFGAKPKLLKYQTGSNRLSGGSSGATRNPSGTISLPQYMCETFDKDDREDTNFVIKTLAESRDIEEDHRSDETSSFGDARYEEAKTLVESLLLAKIVYRRFQESTGNAYVTANCAYTIRGYFIPAVGGGYQFITHIPLRQHWAVGPDVSLLRRIIPPVMLKSQNFTRNYNTKLDVLEANDLSLCPCPDAPCVNVLVQNMYKENGEDDESHMSSSKE